MGNKTRALAKVIFGIFIGLASTSSAQSLEKRVGELERQQEELLLLVSEGKGRVRTFLEDSISFGGFFENAVTSIYGPDTDFQLSANANTLGLNLAAEYSENVRFVTQMLTGLSFTLQNPHNNPGASPSKRQYGSLSFGAIVAQGFVEYRSSPSFNVQMGLGYAPFGYGFQQRELVLFKRRGGPQMINSSSATGVGIASPLWQGVHLHGSFGQSDTRLGYNLYTFTPFTNTKTLGVGGRVWWASGDVITVGASFQTGMQGVDTFRSYSGDINLKFGRYGLTAEYAGNSLASGAPSPRSYYAEPHVSFFDGVLLLYGAADYLDNTTNVTTIGGSSTADPYRQWRLGGGINWLPLSYTRFRLGYLVHNYVGDTAFVNNQNRRYYSADLSAGIAF